MVLYCWLLNYNAWAVQGECCWSPLNKLAAVLPGSFPGGIQQIPLHPSERSSSLSGAPREYCWVPARVRQLFQPQPCFRVQAISAFSVWGQLMEEMPQNSECLLHVLLLLLSLKPAVVWMELCSDLLWCRSAHTLWACVCEHKIISIFPFLLLWCKKKVFLFSFMFRPKAVPSPFWVKQKQNSTGDYFLATSQAFFRICLFKFLPIHNRGVYFT